MGTWVTPKSAMTSDMRHNHNCYAYLFQLKPYINQHILNLNHPFLEQIVNLSDKYQEDFPYGNLYSKAIAALEEQLDRLYEQATTEQIQALDDFIFAIYHNDNQILENTEWINEIGLKTRPVQVDTSKRIKIELEDNNKLINNISPNTVESIINRLGTLFSANFKPQLYTNLPSLKNYSYRKNINPTEYRFGTQAQSHNGQIRISPLFKRWLLINANRNPLKSPVCYIYFNNLGLDRSKFDIPGSKERVFSLALHELEHNSSLRIAVITLPASESLMDADHFTKIEDQLAYAAVFKELLGVAEGKEHVSGVSDFLIDSKVRNLLFSNEEQQSKILTRLLRNSFKAHGINSSNTLSTAQKQAIWIHFIKFELTDYIISTLDPCGYNFSCKDAIDRGALSSVYYNLMKSFKSKLPMQKEEFERALDAAAANVKGRGMNFHRKIIWNALDSYVNANYQNLLKDNSKSWLIFWRDMNCPHSRVRQLLNKRIYQLQEQLDSLENINPSLHKIGCKLIGAVKEQHAAQINGQRLLLELIARTSQLLTTSSPSQSLIQSYKSLTKELQINYPTLHTIAGSAQIFLGILLFIPSLGYSSALIFNGISTYNTRFFATQRIELSKDILEFTSSYTGAAVA